MYSATRRYVLPALPALEAVERALGAELGLEARGTAEGSLVYYDSFDWRLHRAGLRLYAAADPERGPVVVLQRLDDGDALLRVPCRLETPTLARDLPSAPLRARLAPLLEARALLPVARIAHATRAHVRRDDQGKVVLRVSFDHLALAEGRAEARDQLTVEGVRGYGRALAEAERTLRRHWRLVPAAADPLAWALRAQGRAPGDYVAKPRIALDPGMPANEAMRRVLAAQSDVMRCNEDGILRDLDSEFLHDFRIALRRARALLTHVKRVLPEWRVAHLLDEARVLAAESGALRDLDVHLLALEGYGRMLPEADRPTLEPLATFMAERRAERLDALRRTLGSPGYRRFVDELAGLPGKPVSCAAERATWPINRVAGRAILRTFRRLVREGRAIGPEAPAEPLHALRKRAKALRYLLETFSPLYPKGATRQAAKALAGVQDHLGRFQDLTVHAETLRRLAEAMTAAGRAEPATLLAMGRLVHAFEAEGAEMRAAFPARFAAFDTARTRTRFDALSGRRPDARAAEAALLAAE